MLALMILIALNVADVWLTWRILADGGFEKNPLLASLMRRFGVLPALLSVKTVVLAPFAYLSLSGTIPDWLAWGLTCLYAGVVSNNVKEFLKR